MCREELRGHRVTCAGMPTYFFDIDNAEQVTLVLRFPNDAAAIQEARLRAHSALHQIDPDNGSTCIRVRTERGEEIDSVTVTPARS